jgi:hypothetical protein
MAKPIFEYEPYEKVGSAPRRMSIPAVLMYAGMLTALIHLLLFHLSAGTPIRSGGNIPAVQKQTLDFLKVTDAAIQKAADGQNVELHISPADADSSFNLNLDVISYYSAVYALYPQRAYIGTDEQIINNSAGMIAGDRLPSIAWMRQHHVASVFTFLPPLPPQSVH